MPKWGQSLTLTQNVGWLDAITIGCSCYIFELSRIITPKEQFVGFATIAFFERYSLNYWRCRESKAVPVPAKKAHGE
jgi:hypothetical protein